MENQIPGNKNSTSFGMKTYIAFMMRAIAQEHTWFRPKREFVRVI
jgi:hypothetical protein